MHKSLFVFLLLIVFKSIVMPSKGTAVESNQFTASRQAIVPIASFAASGNIERCKPALHEGLDAGLTVNEIKQILVQLYAYAGFPRSLNALAAFSDVMKERQQKGITDPVGREPDPFPTDGKTVLELGTGVMTTLVGTPVWGSLMDFAPDIDEYLKAHLFGDIFGRNNLDWKSREIATVSALASIAGAENQLRSHFTMSMNIGISADQLKELTDILSNTVDAALGVKARSILNDLLGEPAMTRDSAAVNFEQVADGIIFPRGETNDDYAQYFSGTSYLHALTNSGVPIFNVTFEPGCRNNWHIHHRGGQILLVTSGRGWYQEEGKPAQELCAGDVVKIPAEMKHWHGAAKDSWFVHLAVSVPAEGASTEWCRPVSDEEYGTLP